MEVALGADKFTEQCLHLTFKYLISKQTRLVSHAMNYLNRLFYSTAHCKCCKIEDFAFERT